MLPKLNDVRTFNQLLSTLNISDSDKIINIVEKGNADGNFIITHLLKQIIYEKNKACLLLLHNDLDHYQITGKKLGYNINEKIKENVFEVIDGLNGVTKVIGEETPEVTTIVEEICAKIGEATKNLSPSPDGVVYLVVDDVSHLLDVGLGTRTVLSFLNYCVNLVSDRLRLIVSSHVSCKLDKVISNYLCYVSDVNVTVSALSTGQSVDVSGHLTIDRTHNFENKNIEYLFKCFDRGIKVFAPGESVYNLYK